MITLGAHLARIRTDRASVVPYIVERTEDGDRLYFLFARDKISGEITDLGGGVKKNEFSLMAALREFREESDEIFGNIYDEINDSATLIAVIDSNKMAVLFLPLQKEWYTKAPKMFANRPMENIKRTHNEVSELLWYSEDELKKLLSSRNTMWTRLRRFYRRSYTNTLKQMLKLKYSQ